MCVFFVAQQTRSTAGLVSNLENLTWTRLNLLFD